MRILSVFIFLSLIFGIHFRITAQKSLAVRAGINMNNQLEEKFSTEDLNPGVLLGVGLINDFGEHFGSGLELTYIEKSALHVIDSVEVKDINQYIELGVSVRLRKQWESSSIYLTGGMLLSFWQGGARAFEDEKQEEITFLSYPDARSELDVGMYLGAGFTFKGIVLEVRTLQGLIDISNDKYDTTPIFNQGISLSLGYAFALDN